MKTAKLLWENDSASVLLKTRQAMRNVKFRDLLYMDISGHWVNFHLSGGELVEVYGSLKDYEDTLLMDPRFARCHKSFVINMDFVEVVELRQVRMKNGDCLPISKRYINFKKQYAEWING